MVLYKNEEKKRYCVLAQIESIEDGQGNSKGMKVSVVLSYKEKGTVVCDRVDVWNPKDTTKLQLADLIKKEEKGSMIIAIISKDTDDHCLLAYMKNGSLHFNKGEENEVNIISGKPSLLKADKTADGEKVFRIKMDYPSGDNIVSHKITFHNDKKEAEKARKVALAAKEDNCGIVIVAGAQKEKNGFLYKGLRMYKMNDKKVLLKETNLDTIITLGPYKRNPTKLGDILENTSEQKRKNLLLWMKYIAEEWMPENNCKDFENFMCQKEEIQKYLSNNN